MNTTASSSDATAFFEQLVVSVSRLLVINYDAVIEPFRRQRWWAAPDPLILQLLDTISSCRTRVVVFSGHSAQEVRLRLSLAHPLEIWGLHGLERFHADGRREMAFVRQEASQAIEHARVLLKREGLAELCNFRTGAVTVHWTGLSQRKQEKIRTLAYQLLAPVACGANLVLDEFETGIDLRVRGASNVDAVRVLLSEVPNDASTAYLGGEATDEEVFREMKGRGLTVRVHAHHVSTAAQIRLEPRKELIRFLSAWSLCTAVTYEP